MKHLKSFPNNVLAVLTAILIGLGLVFATKATIEWLDKRDEKLVRANLKALKKFKRKR